MKPIHASLSPLRTGMRLLLSASATAILLAPAGAQVGETRILAGIGSPNPSAMPKEFGPQEFGPEDWRARPDWIAPMAVVADRQGDEGAWSFSYQTTRTNGSGLLSGRGPVSSGDVFAQGFAATPVRTVRVDHLMSALYGYSEEAGVLITLPWVNNEVTMKTSVGQLYGMRSTGMGDLLVTGLFALEHEENEQFHVQFGISLPTGSGDERATTPLSGGVSAKLPYSMQLSSGTVDIIPGVTYLVHRELTTLGAQATQTFRFSENSDGYQLGNETTLTTWVSRMLKEDLSGSLRFDYFHAGTVSGQDANIDPSLSPMHVPGNQGGDSIRIRAGLNYTQPGGHTFGFEFGGPLWQSLNGPQVKDDISYSVGWHYSF